MTIEYSNGNLIYYDMKGEQIEENDLIKLYGRVYRVLLTEQNTLGTDATNPAWLKAGRAVEGEYGVYPFNEYDNPEIVCKAGQYEQYDPATGNYK